MTRPVAACPNCSAPVEFRWSSAVQTVCGALPFGGSAARRRSEGGRRGGGPAAVELADSDRHARPLSRRRLHGHRPHRLRVRARHVERVARRVCRQQQRLAVGRTGGVRRVTRRPEAGLAAGRLRPGGRPDVRLRRPHVPAHHADPRQVPRRRRRAALRVPGTKTRCCLPTCEPPTATSPRSTTARRRPCCSWARSCSSTSSSSRICGPPDTGPQAKTAGFNCRNCGAAIELRAVELTKSVACTSCAAIQEPNDPNVLILQEAQARERYVPKIPLGTRGTLARPCV